MVATWMRDNTFAHGFLIPALSGYALWLKRAELRLAAIQPSALALIVLLLAALVWYIGDIAGVQVDASACGGCNDRHSRVGGAGSRGS